MIRKLLVGFAMVIVAATQAEAAGLKLGVPAYGGTGCPAGTASLTLSPDETELSVLFDQFVAEAGSTTQKRIDRKSCSLSIPVQVPQGYSIAIFQVDYRGFNAIPYGAYNKFDAEYFWAGMRGPKISRLFSGPLVDNFTVTDQLIASALVWTACSDSVNLRVNASLLAQTNRAMEQTTSSIDSVDVSSGLIYHIQWRRCQ